MESECIVTKTHMSSHQARKTDRLRRMEIANRIKELMEENKVKGPGFAKLAGVSRAAVSSWMRGRDKPGRDALLALQKKIGVNPDWLLHGKNPKYSTYNNNSIIGETSFAALVEAVLAVDSAQRAEGVALSKDVFEKAVRHVAREILAGDGPDPAVLTKIIKMFS